MRPLLRAGLVLLLGALLLLPATAGAQEDESQQRRDELGLSISVGYDGRSRAETWQPVAIGLEPVRPVAGTLSVTVRDRSRESLAVEVAAGSRKVYRFVLPSGRLEVTFAEAGEDPLTVRPSADPVTGEYLVGRLGGAADDLPPLRSDVTGQSGAWVTLDPAWLELSAQALEPLGAVVADAAALQSLAPAATRNLAAAVASGIDLVVVGGNPDDLGTGLPWKAPDQPWEVGPEAFGVSAGGAGDDTLATAFAAGAGRIVTTDIAPGGPGFGRRADFWSLIAQPPARPADAPGDYKVTTTPHQFARLLSEGGGNTPTLPGLGAFVVMYVLVVGPVNGIVLARMGRRELAWVTVPLVTVVFTIGAFVGATAARPETGGITRLTYWADGPATEVVAAGVRAPTPGARSVSLPGGEWTVRPLVDGGGASAISRGADTTVTMDLTALQLGGVAAWRTIQASPPLEVRARANADGVNVTIRNTSGRALTDVTTRIARSSRSLGTVAAGGEASVKIPSARLSPGSAYSDPFEGLRIDGNGATPAPRSMQAILNTEVIQGRPGMVWVSGVSEAPVMQATSGGQSLRDRGSMVAVGAVIEASKPGLSPFAVARDVIYDGRSTHPIGASALEGNGEVFLRFRLPPGIDGNDLTNELARSGQSHGNPQLTVWDARQRQWVALAEGFSSGSPDRLIGPAGEVWVRASGQLFPFEFAGRSVAGRTP